MASVGDWDELIDEAERYKTYRQKMREIEND